MVRLMITEDEELIRKALCLLAGSFEGVCVVGEARDGAEAVSLASRVAPDVVLMDLVMPVMDGIEATRAIKREHPAIKVVALTAVGRGREIADGLAAGLDGYVLKKAPPDELRAAIATTAAGGRHISAAIAGVIGEAIRAARRQDDPGVSPREAEVLEFLCQGCRAKEIADRLGISARTVEKHRDSLRKKYGVDTIAQLVAVYVRRRRGTARTPARPT